MVKEMGSVRVERMAWGSMKEKEAIEKNHKVILKR